jgi:predicted lactoylglutathione lyase
MLLCLSAESRDAVDAQVAAAAGAGGTIDVTPKQDMGGMMYGRSFEDPDGHIWEVMWMASQAAEQGAAAFEAA